MQRDPESISHAINMTNKVIQFNNDYGHLPDYDSDGVYESVIGVWLYKLRDAKIGKGQRQWHPECDETAKRNNLPELFNHP